MAEVTQEHRALAVELVSKFGCWGKDMSGRPHALGHIDIDLAAQALADAEQRGYARGLADGAERERAAVVAYLWKRQRIIAAPIAEEVESGKHLEKSE